MKRLFNKFDSKRWTGEYDLVEPEVLALVLLCGAIMFLIVAGVVGQ